MNPATQHAALKALRFGIDDAIKVTQAETLALSEETGADRWKTPFGIVGVVHPKPGVYVKSDRDLLAWVREHAPAEVMEVVRESYRKALVDSLEIHGDEVVDPCTGEVVAWAGVRQGAGSYLSVREAAEPKQRALDLVHDRLDELAAFASPKQIEPGGEV